ncbi:hypothetical protein BG015_003471 [Linnemannia schmuckeri]|uniref:Uncharacterized protein n=1 Tax=Linnemannia schmuckeri TaxID=64567 RepID=A0A9P5VCT4_9FUNG|nr:hypothetical protein BG015_003471 [Linnemannia schmuckeri]
MDNNQNQNHNHSHNPNDILISVDPISPQETTPPTPTTTLHSSNQPTSPLVSPTHLRLPNQNDEPREPPILPSVEPDYGFPLQPTSSNGIDPLSPNTINGGTGTRESGRSMADYSDRSHDVPRPLSPPHLPIHQAFRSGGDAHYRYPHSGNATPSVRSLRLPGHQQSNRPYNPSLFRNNEYHPPMGGHRNVDGQHDTGKPMVIDYAGLDTSATEVSRPA